MCNANVGDRYMGSYLSMCKSCSVGIHFGWDKTLPWALQVCQVFTILPLKLSFGVLKTTFCLYSVSRLLTQKTEKWVEEMSCDVWGPPVLRYELRKLRYEWWKMGCPNTTLYSEFFIYFFSDSYTREGEIWTRLYLSFMLELCG